MENPGTDSLHEELAAWLQARDYVRGEDAGEHGHIALARAGGEAGTSDGGSPASGLSSEAVRDNVARTERATVSSGEAATRDSLENQEPDAGTSPDPTFRVERVFREGAAETTQLVWFRGVGGGELGPFVRKVIRDGSGIGAAYETLARAQREGKRLRHVPRVHSCTHEGSSLVVLLEYIPGATLREVIAGAEPAQRRELAARIMPALCDAASELHEAFDPPLIHRDLTPGNVVCPEGDPTCLVLIDLGIARSWSAHATADTTHFGTRAYAPPEQFGFGQTDVRSDVYALGLLAFFCLTGKDPEPADRERGFVVPGIDKAWREVIAKAAEYDPQRRYACARELRDACVAAAEAAERAYRWGEGAPGNLTAGMAEETGAFGLEITANYVRAAEGDAGDASPTHAAAALSEQDQANGSANSPLQGHAPQQGASQECVDSPVQGCASQQGIPLARAGAPVPPAPVVPDDDAPAPAPSASPIAPPAEDMLAQPVTPGEPAPTLRQAILAIASHVPYWVGRTWNVLVVLSTVLLVAASLAMSATVGQHASINSPGIDLFGYLIYMPVLFLVTGYALLDRRRLRRRFPVLAQRTILKEWGLCVLVILALTVLLVVLIAIGV